MIYYVIDVKLALPTKSYYREPNPEIPFHPPFLILSTHPTLSNEFSYGHLIVPHQNFLISASISWHKPKGILKHPIVLVGIAWITDFIKTSFPACDSSSGGPRNFSQGVP